MKKHGNDRSAMLVSGKLSVGRFYILNGVATFLFDRWERDVNFWLSVDSETSLRVWVAQSTIKKLHQARCALVSVRNYFVWVLRDVKHFIKCWRIHKSHKARIQTNAKLHNRREFLRLTRPSRWPSWARGKERSFLHMTRVSRAYWKLRWFSGWRWKKVFRQNFLNSVRVWFNLKFQWNFSRKTTKKFFILKKMFYLLEKNIHYFGNCFIFSEIFATLLKNKNFVWKNIVCTY